jgi:CheY-like chemotaxis protein
MMILNNKTIFIVEDNIQNRVIFQMALVMNGANVEFERWGKDTLGRLQAVRQVDLIILDLMLPGGVTGYDIYDEIRAVEKYQSVPIIAVSAADPSIALPKTRSKGFFGFIAKPIDDTLFPRQIADVLAGKAIWYAGERYHTFE